MPITAIYHFARCADDIADEGDAAPDQRLADLAAMRNHLQASPTPQDERWSRIFLPLHAAIDQFGLPVTLLVDLLDAFEQDIRKTRDQAGYADRAELLDYCRRSANPVGRLLLHVYGVHDSRSLRQSDAICSALQLINFWQDLSIDLPRGRHYLPREDCAVHGVKHADLLAQRQTPAVTRLIREEVQWARSLMQQGAPLVHGVPGRAGWELRLVVQGGLRILDKIEALEFATLKTRPKLGVWDAIVMLWRTLWM